MTISATVTNKADRVIYVLGYPLKPGETNNFPFMLGKLSIVSDIGYVIIDEDERVPADCNSKLHVEKVPDHKIFDIVER